MTKMRWGRLRNRGASTYKSGVPGSVSVGGTAGGMWMGGGFSSDSYDVLRRWRQEDEDEAKATADLPQAPQQPERPRYRPGRRRRKTHKIKRMEK